MTIALSALILCAALFSSTLDPPPVDPQEIERIAEAVDRVFAAPRRFEGVVRRRLYMGTPGTAIRVDHDAPRMEDRTLLRVLGPDHATVWQYDRMSVDVFFRGSRYGVHLAERDAMVERDVGDRSGFGLALLAQSALFMPFDIPTGSGASPGALLRDSLPISLEVDGTVATYRYRAAGEQRALDARRTAESPRREAWARSVTVDIAEPPRILGWSTDVPRRGLDLPAEPDRWLVEEWQEFDGLPLPRRIRRETRIPGAENAMAEYVQVTDFERIAPLPEACATERPLPAGLPVEGLGIRFTVGSSNATRDGRSFRLAEPLWFLPEPEGLEALFRDARER